MENNKVQTNRTFKIVAAAAAIAAGVHLFGSIAPAPSAAAEWMSSREVSQQVVSTQNSDQGEWKVKLLHFGN